MNHYITILVPGFNVETVEYKNISFTVWDVGGQVKLRPSVEALLPEHRRRRLRVGQQRRREAAGGQGGAGRHRECWGRPRRRPSSSRPLLFLLESEEVAGVPLLVVANKQDLPGALSVPQLSEGLDLRRHDRPWHVQPTCAITSEGVYEALDWLARELAYTGTPGASPYAAGPQRGHGRGIRTREDPNTGRVEHKDAFEVTDELSKQSQNQKMDLTEEENAGFTKKQSHFAFFLSSPTQRDISDEDFPST
ncbi:ADP-ribosylation factor [Penaeus vannamei]|uniref:ADP-ribosylation factor n=1 Tax=Penaeus vannamei TaxID=6689 RepID=A0A3R7LTM8_PENVA|nr:ADP-ribosylation factor [Penaeus vannamei]